MRTVPVRISKKYREIFAVKPNSLGNPLFDLLYKSVVRFFKTAPFVVIIPTVMLMVVLIYLIVGPLLVRLASMLQYGF